VPFSLHGGTALGTGRGERLTPVLGNGTYSWVLAIAAGGLSTPAVYAELDRLRCSGPVTVVGDPAAILTALRSADPLALGRALSNDLQPAACSLVPGLRRVLAAGRGPTVALLARDPAHAATLAAGLTKKALCRSVRVADSPASGARICSSRAAG
jgi:4-diphosphocytidyl-2-C-methyl-D-erythritol kinase